MKFNNFFFSFFLVCLAFASIGQDLSPELSARYSTLTNQLRCPTCQNQAIADSNSTISESMREGVKTMLLQGKSDEQIIEHYVARYGEFVSFSPSYTGHFLLWIFPLLVVSVSGILVLWRFRR